MEAEISPLMMLLRTGGALVLVLGLIFAISAFAKKYLKSETWSPRGSAGLKIIQSFSLAPKKKLMVVEVEGQKLLLGVAENSISFLCSLTRSASASSASEGEVTRAVV